MKISESFAEEQVEILKDREDVRAVAVVGSYARNPEGDHNDLDLYIIVDGNWRRRVTEKVDGVVVEKLYNSMQRSEKYLEGDDWAFNYRWYSNADVRYDPENLFVQLVKKAEEVKEEKLSEGVDEDELLYFIWDMQQDLDTRDVGQKRFMMYKLFDYLLEKIYELKEEVPVKENYRIEKLQEFDGYMYKLAQEFLTSSSTYEKEKKLEKMVEHVTKNIGEAKPEWKTEKEFME